MDPNTYFNEEDILKRIVVAKSHFDRASQHVLEVRAMRLRSWQRIYAVCFGKNSLSFMKILGFILDQSTFHVDSWDEKNGAIILEGDYGNPLGEIHQLDTCLNTLTNLMGFVTPFTYTKNRYLHGCSWKLILNVCEETFAQMKLWRVENDETKAKNKLQEIATKKKAAEKELNEIIQKKKNLRRKMNPVDAKNPQSTKKTATG